MPFGLTNAPATFQRVSNLILTRFKRHSFLVYIDYIIIYSNSVEKHILHVDEILAALAAAGVTLKLKKCTFFRDVDEYLGHIVKPRSLGVGRINPVSLRDAKPATNKK